MPDATRFAIAIDGPAASGKSTLARLLAKRLGLIMVNSGDMYRAVTWKALQENIDPHDTAAVAGLLDRIDIECGSDGIMSTIAIDGVEPGDKLRSEAVNANVSAIPGVVASGSWTFSRVEGFKRRLVTHLKILAVFIR